MPRNDEGCINACALPRRLKMFNGPRTQNRLSDTLGFESVVFDDTVGKRLAVCPYIKKVLFSRESSPSVFHSWNMCSLSSDKGHCDFHGKRLKFSSYGSGSLRVIWVCPKIVDLSFLRSDVHG